MDENGNILYIQKNSTPAAFKNGITTQGGVTVATDVLSTPTIVQATDGVNTIDMRGGRYYDRLRSGVLEGRTCNEMLNRQGISLQQYRYLIKAKYADAGKMPNDDGADREIVAAFAAEFFFDKQADLAKIVDRDRGFVAAIRDFLYEMRIRFHGTSEANYLAAMEFMYTKALEKSQGKIGGEAQYSIKQYPDGRKYVKSDNLVPFGNDSEKWNADLGIYLHNTLLKGNNVKITTDDGDVLTITPGTVWKLEDRNKIELPSNHEQLISDAEDAEYKEKLIAAGNIDEIVQISKRGSKVEPDRKKHEIARDGWNYRTAYYEAPDGTYYRLRISVGLNGNVKEVYNIGSMKKRSKPTVNGSSLNKEGALSVGFASNNKIPQKSVPVNTYYMQNSQNDATQKTAVELAFEQAQKGNNSQNSLGSSKMEEEMQRLLDKYGAIPAGEKPARDVEFPKATDDGKVRRAYRTMAEAAGTPDEMVAPLQEQALSDTYVPIGDKQHINWSRI